MGREIKMLTDSNMALSEAVHLLTSKQTQTRDAIRDRFQQSEIVDSELEGSLNSLKTEVRVWHRVDPNAYGATGAPSRVRESARETDQSLTRIQNALPQDDPLAGL
jgi:hypothetical protein